MAKKSTRKKSSKKKTTRRSAAPKDGALGTVSSEMLQAELAKRQRQAGSLLRRRDKLRAQLDAVEAEIRAAGMALHGVGGGRRRARNSMNLVDAMHGVLQNHELSVTDLAEAVQAAGYTTTSPNFRTIVNQTLIKNPKAFKRVARGIYTAK